MSNNSVKTTRYSASTSEVVEAAWKLKRLTETHEMRQRALQEEYKKKSIAITDELQVSQSAAFESVRKELDIPDSDWGDGQDWALNISELGNGTVAMVHKTDGDAPNQKGGCGCPACTLAGLLGLTDNDEDDSDVQAHGTLH